MTSEREKIEAVRAGELGSIYAKAMIEALLSVHALTNMHRSSGDDEYRKTAAGWLPILESQFSSLRSELSRRSLPEKDGEE